MLRIFAILAVCWLAVLNGGCGSEKPAIKEDPNWRDTTNPSNIVVPEGMKKQPSGPKG